MSTEKAKKRKGPNKENFVKHLLRRGSLKWPARNEALVKSRVDRGKYLCYSCKESFRRTEIHLDHINPVIDPSKGFTTWDDYIDRLFCDVEGFNTLCHICHEAKTLTEDNMRVAYRKLKKEK